MTGWIAPRDGGYTGDGSSSGKSKGPVPKGAGAASHPSGALPTVAPGAAAAETQAQVAEACARFLEIAAGVRAQALAADFSPGAAEHMALATYASLAAHLGHQ